MSLGMIGKKAGMTRIFDSSGISIPVTAINVSPNQITQIKTIDKYVNVYIVAALLLLMIAITQRSK